MVKITVVSADNTIEVSGKTYEHKEAIKLLGGKWSASKKIWIGIPNTKENKKALKELKTVRKCGHCGEVGHFKTKCEKFHEENKLRLIEKSKFLCSEEGLLTINKYKRLTNQYCKCGFEDYSYGYEGFSVKIPYTCRACMSWCCNHAHPKNGDTVPSFNYTCPYHGDYITQLLNDTRGT